MMLMDIFTEVYRYIIDFKIAGIELLDVGLLLARLILAIIMLISFKNKVTDIPKFAKSNNLPLPAGYMQVGIEGASGFLLLLGILTPIGALLAMLAMLGSMFFHIFIWHSKYWASSGGWEYDLMIFTLATLIFATGGGIIGLYPLPELGWLPFL